MFSYEVWYERNYVTEDDGFKDEYEAMEDAYEAVKSKMEEWEYDCEQALFLIKLKCNGSLLDEIDGVELEASL
jgi:hypothetical protein